MGNYETLVSLIGILVFPCSVYGTGSIAAHQSPRSSHLTVATSSGRILRTDRLAIGRRHGLGSFKVRCLSRLTADRCIGSCRTG